MTEEYEQPTPQFIYAYSQLTGNWYKVTEWEEGEGNNITNTGRKVEVPREEVPQYVLDAIDEEVY